MRQFCRTQNYWTNWNSKVRGRVKQIDVAPSDGFGKLPCPHILGKRCFCHPAFIVSKEGIPIYVHEHPLTEMK
jgi:hypothetical protein